MNYKNIAEIGSLPKMSATEELIELSSKMLLCRSENNQIIWLLDDKAIEAGLSKYIIEFIKMGFVSHIGITGRAMIADIELAKVGSYQEKLKNNMGHIYYEINEIIKTAAINAVGIGRSIGLYLQNSKYANYSILSTAYNMKIPITVHMAIGSEIIASQDNFDAKSAGLSTGVDFKKFSYAVSKLNKGIILNFSDNPLFPEIIENSIRCAAELGIDIRDVLVVNVGPIMQSRMSQYKTINLISQYEFTLPCLYQWLKADLNKRKQPYKTGEMIKNEFPEPKI